MTVFLRKLIALMLAISAPAARAATLIHTNDVLGDIEPCGCRTNPLGGMARKANLIAKLADQSLLQLDAGDLLFSSAEIPDLLAPQAELQAGYLLKSMDKLHHDAVVPGEKDFALGLAMFRKLYKRTRIHVLAANLVRADGRALFEKSRIFSRKTADGKPLKIAVVGLVGDDLAFPPELKVLPSIAAARAEVSAVRGRADLVVLLTHEGFDKDKELAEKVPGIDVIVGGHTQTFLQDPIRIGRTTIYQSSFRNQYVGVLPIAKPFTGEGYRLVGLDPAYDSPKDSPGPTDRLVAEFKQAVGQLNSREDEKMESVVRRSPLREEAKFQTFPKCAECHLRQFDFWRKTPHALALHALVERDQFKNKECLSCHTVGMGDPLGFEGVNHLAELQKSGDGVAPDLSTEQLSAYLQAIHDAKSLKDTVRLQPQLAALTVRASVSSLKMAWTPVQCENCHLPGRDHPFSAEYSKTVEKTVCLKCHTSDRAPQWYTKSGQPDWEKIQAKRTLVTCPAGTSGEAEE